jgi:cyclin-dependent kinase 15
VSRLPNYRPHKMCYYRGVQRLGHAWPRLLEVPLAESLANLLLQPKANKRLSADQALMHRYFSDLPPSIHELDDGKLKEKGIRDN